jgi:trimeric autotransporter adhesin
MVSETDHSAGGFRTILLKLRENTRAQFVLFSAADTSARCSRAWGLFAVIFLAICMLAGCGNISPNLGVAPTQSSEVDSVFPQTAIAAQNTSPITVTVGGQGFVSGSLVLWNFQPLTTTYINSGELTAVVPVSNLASPATISVGVISPGRTTASTAGNNLSNFIAFTVYPANTPTPAITTLAPTSAAAGSSAFVLTVTGTNLLSTTMVLWNNQACPFTNPTPGTPVCITVPGSSTQVTAQIPASYVATVPTTQPRVSVSTPSGGTSNSVIFTITSAVQSALDHASQLASSAQRVTAMTTAPRFVAYVVAETDATTESGLGAGEIFLQDTCQGAPADCTPQTTLISTPIFGTVPDGASFAPSTSTDGRYVLFASDATNLVPGDNDGVTDIFLRDTCNGAPAGCTPATTIVSVTPDGGAANGASTAPAISPDGRYVAFDSVATNLVLDNLSNTAAAGLQTFLRDTCHGGPVGCTPSTTRLIMPTPSAQ